MAPERNEPGGICPGSKYYFDKIPLLAEAMQAKLQRRIGFYSIKWDIDRQHQFKVPKRCGNNLATGNTL